MTKDVLVSISGLHMEGDEPIEVLSAGIYYFKNGKHYVLLEETQEGIPGVTKTQIKWKEDEILEVSKRGLSNVHMVFEKNKQNRCMYATPYGQLNMGIFTTELSGTVTESRIDIHTEYALEVDFEPVADCEITIKVQSKEVKEFML